MLASRRRPDRWSRPGAEPDDVADVPRGTPHRARNDHRGVDPPGMPPAHSHPDGALSSRRARDPPEEHEVAAAQETSEEAEDRGRRIPE